MYAQTDVLPEGETAFVQAMAIERSGDLDRAIKIYYQILKKYLINLKKKFLVIFRGINIDYFNSNTIKQIDYSYSYQCL